MRERMRERTVSRRALAALVLLAAGMSSAQVAVRASGDAVKTQSDAAEEKPKPPMVVFERVWEPREKAFSFLQPKGWTIEGGIFNVNPLQAGGPGNSLEPKCDLLVKKDDAASVYFRWLPGYNYADLSQGQFAMTSGFFPAGSSYQGMRVFALCTVEAFLTGYFKMLHPQAVNARLVKSEPIPELVEIYRRLQKPVCDALVQMGLPPWNYSAGGVLIEYTENGRPYQEAMVTAIVDCRASAAMWNNNFTLSMRAPMSEAKAWKTTFDIIRQSLQFNPQWVAAVAKAAQERGQLVQDTMRYIAKIDREIAENRRKTNAAIRYEGYLLLSGQEDYVNPYTKEVEVDTSDYKYRWTTEGGGKLYTDDRTLDPNRDRTLNQTEWKLTPVRKRD